MSVDALEAEVLSGPDEGATARATTEVLAIGTAEGNQLRLTDPTVSRFHLDLRATPEGIRVEDHGSTNGTRVNSVRVERATVAAGSVLSLGDTRVRVRDAGAVDVELASEGALPGLIGRSPAMRRLVSQVRKLARSDVSVLLVGESGTGKECIARVLHESGVRAGRPFVTVDCGALAPALILSELFGHEKGAFTGAERRRDGAFEQARGGTVLLDEIGELPAALQSTLLGVLERGRFRRVGGSEDVSVDVRVIGATHRDLRREVNEGRFRLDLYYRLAVVTVRAPPLRDRSDDLVPLVDHFLRQAGYEGEREALYGASTFAALARHRWPGNVRELRNFVEATLALGEAPELLTGAGLGQEAPEATAQAQDVMTRVLDRRYREARSAVLHELEARYLTRLVERAGQNLSQAARISGLDRGYLRQMLRRHGLRE